MGSRTTTAEIQAALNAGDEIYLPAGTYLISSTLAVTTGQTIFGAGSGATVLKTAAGTGLGTYGLIGASQRSPMSLSATSPLMATKRTSAIHRLRSCLYPVRGLRFATSGSPMSATRVSTSLPPPTRWSRAVSSSLMARLHHPRRWSLQSCFSKLPRVIGSSATRSRGLLRHMGIANGGTASDALVIANNIISDIDDGSNLGIGIALGGAAA